jgi:hypothetical protein
MPLSRQTRAGGGSQFTGASDTTGLFAFDPSGKATIQVRIKSVTFYTESTITGWTLNFVDEDGNVMLWQDGTSENFALADGTQGIIVLPNATGTSQPWSLSFTTDTMAASGTISVDYDYVAMQ